MWCFLPENALMLLLLFLFWPLSGNHKLWMGLVGREEGGEGGSSTIWRGGGVAWLQNLGEEGWGQKWGNWCVMESAGREIGTRGRGLLFEKSPNKPMLAGLKKSATDSSFFTSIWFAFQCYFIWNIKGHKSFKATLLAPKPEYYSYSHSVFKTLFEIAQITTISDTNWTQLFFKTGYFWRSIVDKSIKFCGFIQTIFH